MDELVKQLESATISEKRTEREEHDQNERRKDLLEMQRRECNHSIYKSRAILELVQAMDEGISHTPRPYWRPSVHLQGYGQTNYFNVLSGSEWLLQKPDDFAENWVVAACPRGIRMLVIAFNGTTKCFDKYGYYRFEFRTALPGGNPCEIITKNKICVLDCFYSEETKTMFVLDILAFNNHMMSYGEVAFRQYWLENHIGADDELKKYTKKNRIIFKVLPKIPCTTESLKQFLSVFPYFSDNRPCVDGLLFYHTKAQYFSGETPLVGWLYPYMLPELLGEELNIHKVYLLEKPSSYVNYLHFIEKFEARSKRKKQRLHFGSGSCQGNLKKNNGVAAVMSTNIYTDNPEAQYNDVAGAMYRNICNPQAQDNAAGPVPADINSTEIAETEGDDLGKVVTGDP